MSNMENEAVRADLVQITSNVERADDGEAATTVGGLNRRNMLKALAATAALPLLVDGCAVPDSTPGSASTSAAGGKVVPGKGPRGTPSDPVLIDPKPKVPWPKVLTPAELTTLASLCDMIIPADDKSPAASKVGAPDYINEISSEPSRGTLLVQIRGGVAWINGESNMRFGKPFHEITDDERTKICDDLCFVPKAKPEHMAGALFFDRVRDLTAGAFYTTPEGWKDIGYIGNVALPEFKGPPLEVLQKLGLV
ncbi:MAG: gluconate 2-dehydrogenase subunit 3 family protein [Gemmatimonas sp.]